MKILSYTKKDRIKEVKPTKELLGTIKEGCDCWVLSNGDIILCDMGEHSVAIDYFYNNEYTGMKDIEAEKEHIKVSRFICKNEARTERKKYTNAQLETITKYLPFIKLSSEKL
ncbi:MAG: hypothetical protein BWY78_01279 [Alphaproteobacteria bacterium ADurb.Bin438]|nr:MAG: hypothetical protein BWY78_01279 [Alphaproteobacteria bacterium ADurb.Bin438]